MERKNTPRNSPPLTACLTNEGSVWFMVSRRIQHCKEFLSECDYLSRPEIGGTYSAEVFMKLFSAATSLLSLGKDEGVSPNPKLLWGFLSFLCRTWSGPPSPREIP